MVPLRKGELSINIIEFVDMYVSAAIEEIKG
jgi:hypothetical protein